MLKSLSLTSFLAGSLLAFTMTSPVMAADTYTLDPTHTAVVWHISHFGFSSPSGKFMNAEGTLVLDQQNPALSKVTVSFPIGAMDTGVPKLDEHLKTKDFFDVDEFPTATFTSDKVDVTGKDTALVHGTLTLRGVSKPIVLNVKLNKLGENIMKKPTAGFSATTALKRSDFGMTSYLPGLGDDVQIDIESEANLASNGG